MQSRSHKTHDGTDPRESQGLREVSLPPVLTSRWTDFSRTLKDDEIVLIYAEDSDRPYKVQRTLLTRLSKWFETALSDRFVEGQRLELRFPDTHKRTLELFLYWLFERVLPEHAGDVDVVRDCLDIWPEQLAYVRLWAFADKHFAPALQNAAMRSLYPLVAHEAYPSMAIIRGAYKNSPASSTMRDLMMTQISSGLLGKVYDSLQVGKLGDIPGFTKHLAETCRLEMLGERYLDDGCISLDEYLVDEGEDAEESERT